MVSVGNVGVENDDRDVETMVSTILPMVPAVVTIEFSQVLVSLLGFTTWLTLTSPSLKTATCKYQWIMDVFSFVRDNPIAERADVCGGD